MEIKLLRLEIRRFKGCRALDLELGGKFRRHLRRQTPRADHYL